MSEKNISIKEADRTVFRTSFDDGLVDIFISCVVLMLVVGPLLSVYLGDYWSSAIFIPFWAAVSLILLWTRKNVIKPRAGVVKYSPMRKKKLTLFTGIMLTLNVVFFILGLVAFATPSGRGWTITIAFAGMLLISFSLAGYFLDVTRFYLYGLMLSGGFFLGEWLYRTYGVSHHGIPIVFGISTGIIFLIGLFKFITFVQDNPLPTDDPMQLEGKNG
jgi:MFS family permease